jgi:hypothetical protein
MTRFIITIFSIFFFISCNSNRARSALDIKMVENLNEIHISQQASQELEKNGFVLTHTPNEDIYDVYSDLNKRGRPVFVTTDLVLHTDHLLFDYILRIIEIKELYPLVSSLSAGMYNELLDRYKSESFTAFEKEALERDIGFFAVACRIFDREIKLPQYIEKEAEEELELIEEAKGFATSPLFGIKEDYSQYKPRGHYTRNENFKRYFKALMWFGRISFFTKPPISILESGNPEVKGKSFTLSALYITYVLNKNPLLFEDYQKIYNITSFFVGESDDLGVEDYNRLLSQVYGKEVNFKTLSQEQHLLDFIEKVKQENPPKIISGFLTDQETDELPRAFKFMGQRFIPDSYMFQNLVYDKVTQFTGSGKPFTAIPSQLGIVRGFPRGLDVMAVLGCKKALEILEKEGDTSYNGYESQMNTLQQEFSELDKNQWGKNFYFRTIYAFKKILDNVDEFANPYLNREAWVKKVLNTLLGAWAELRHDTILYAKQSYTIEVTSVPPRPKKTKLAYVEAYQSFYDENKKFINAIIEILEDDEMLPDEVLRKLNNFHTILNELSDISKRENKMEKLDSQTVEYIRTIPARLKGVISFSPQLMNEITDGTDSKMAVIADVHTDVNTKQVLEVGVGNPLRFFIVVPVENKPYIMEGATFSFYEFKKNMSERLTDEEWQNMIKSRNLPPLQKWFKEFVK